MSFLRRSTTERASPAFGASQRQGPSTIQMVEPLLATEHLLLGFALQNRPRRTPGEVTHETITHAPSLIGPAVRPVLALPDPLIPVHVEKARAGAHVLDADTSKSAVAR